MSSHESRLDQRIDVEIPVKLRFPDQGRATGLALNLALGGLFVWTHPRPRRSGAVEVSMILAGPEGTSELRFPATVVQHSALGIGLKFGVLDPLAEAALQHVIAREALPDHETDLARRTTLD